MNSFQSGILDPCNAANRLRELLPATPLLGQNFASVRGQTVIAPPPLARLFHPTALNPATRLHPVKERIERCRLKPQSTLGALFDQLADLVTVAGAALHQREDQQFGAALLEFAV